MGVAERKLERIVKGAANHRRIQIMRRLRAEPALSLGEIATAVGVDFRVASEHVRRLAIAGLVRKRNHGRRVEHTLSDRGSAFLTFLDGLR